jgi:rubrerythrin
VTAHRLGEEHVPASVRAQEDEAERRLFVMRIVQPGLAGLMDGSVSTLAPLFAAAFATTTVSMPSSSACASLARRRYLDGLRRGAFR